MGLTNIPGLKSLDNPQSFLKALSGGGKIPVTLDTLANFYQKLDNLNDENGIPMVSFIRDVVVHQPGYEKVKAFVATASDATIQSQASKVLKHLGFKDEQLADGNISKMDFIQAISSFGSSAQSYLRLRGESISESDKTKAKEFLKKLGAEETPDAVEKLAAVQKVIQKIMPQEPGEVLELKKPTSVCTPKGCTL
jgi:hypothetical protein